MLAQQKLSNVHYKYLIIFLLFGTLFTVIFSYIGYFIFKEPAEDALILFCFSENLANTGVISYYPGGPAAEGATDFLWMLLLALLYKLGLPSFFATHLISGFSLAGIFYFLNKLYQHVYQQSMSYLEFLAFGCLFVFGSLYIYAVIAGFSVYFFGVAIAATVYYFLTEDSRKFAIAGLLLCLIRPDGFILAAPLAICLIFNKALSKTTTIKHLCYYAIIPGVIYFIARWQYFGELLPLPFYVKTGWEYEKIDLLGFRASPLSQIIADLFRSCGGLLLLAMLSLLANNKKHKNLTDQHIKFMHLLLVIAIICLFYSRIVLEQNVGDRFFILYTLPILMLFIYIKQITEVINKKHYFILASIFTIFTAHRVGEHYRLFINDKYQDIEFVLGKQLHKIKDKGKLFTTEAGAVTYYSKWQAYDPWGLATRTFSKQIFYPEDLENYNPDIIYVGTAWVDRHIYDVLLQNNNEDYFNKMFKEVKSARRPVNLHINLVKASYKYGYELWLYNKTNLIALKQDSKIYKQLKQIFIRLNITKIN